MEVEEIIDRVKETIKKEIPLDFLKDFVFIKFVERRGKKYVIRVSHPTLSSKKGLEILEVDVIVDENGKIEEIKKAA